MMKVYYCAVLLLVFLLSSCMLEGGPPGPAGGYVFYDKGEYSDGWRYLECAPEDANEGNVGWDSAKTLCEAYTLGGYNDWYLPTTQELTWMYNNLHKKSMGRFKKEDYWSSEKSGSSYYYVDFDDGHQGSYYSFSFSSSYFSSYFSYYARPVRRF